MSGPWPLHHPAPLTAAAAKAAATAYFDFWAAGQYAATSPLLSPAARKVISRHVWIAAHLRCRGSGTGVAYRIRRPELSGHLAVLNLSAAGVASKLGSVEVTFTYTNGHWYYSPSDLSIYRHKSVRQVVAALNAAEGCSS
jgi:hypothetical protein